MKTLLVIAPQPELAETIRAGLNPEEFSLIHRASLEEAEPLLAHGLADVCVLDVELTGVQGIWLLEKLRRRTAKLPVIIFTGAKQSEWEEEAYLHGVTHVLTKPVRPRLLSTLLDRLFAPTAGRAVPTPPPARIESPPLPANVAGGFASVPSTVAVLRDFSSILTHSLNSEALLKQFLLLLREILSFNRAAIFLRQPYAGRGAITAPEESRRLRSSCAIGLSSGLLEHFELSFDAGIGGQLFHSGRILRRGSDEARADVEAQKEFELLGAQVAVPILDRETLLGVAVFDGRVTGEPLVNAELELIFHLLEQVGLAIRNIWLHDQVVSNHEMMAGVLRELSSGCVVVSRDLKILHANKMARKFFGQTKRASGEMEFTDLPPPLATKVYQVLHTGAGVVPFNFQPEAPPGMVFNVNIVPFQRQDAALPVSALLVVEDLTLSEQLRRLEVEASNLRMIKTMGERLAHEVGNAVVPLSTHQQLFAEKYDDPEFRASLNAALTEGVKRISRLGQQMLFLAQDRTGMADPITVSQLIEDAFREAQKHHQEQTVYLQYETGGQSFMLTGDRVGLKHALAEVMLNAVQANPPMPKVKVSTHADTDVDGTRWVHIDIQDSGTGFTKEAARKVPEPFFTTRNVGLGLGLAVSRKIIETHHGKLKIADPAVGQSGLVTISLPLSPA
jgi:signal transduction histidine kinase/DNA-binding LytR/AlgR family response regulator